MASSWPTGFDSLSTSKADATTSATDHPEHHNDLADAVNKMQRGGPWKLSVKAASTANVNTAAPGASLDGVTLTSGDRILLKDQTAAAQNGIYTWTGAAAALTRTVDADSATTVRDALYVAVEQGTINADTLWELVTNNPVTVGTTSLWFTRVTPSYQRGVALDPWRASGSKLENIPRHYAATVAALTTQQITLVGPFVVPAGMTINSVAFCSSAALATGTNQWFGIVGLSDLAVKAVTANDGATAWGANTFKSLVISGGWTPDVDMAVYAMIMVQATTPPTLIGASANPGDVMRATPKICARDSTTTRTTPVAVGTVLNTTGANQTVVPYCYLG